MAANLGTIKEYQVVLLADTNNTLALTGYGSQCKLVVTAPASRTKPVAFVFRPTGGSTTPTNVDAGTGQELGTLSPRMKPGYPIEVDIPNGTAEMVLHSFEAGDVYVTIYERLA